MSIGQENKKRLKFLVRFIGPVIFIFLLYKYIDIKSSLNTFLVLKWDWFFFSVLFIPASVFVRAIRWRRILRKYGIRYSAWKCFKLCILAGVATSLFSSVGSFVKVFYVNKEKDGLARPVASIVAEKYLDLCLPLGLGVTGFFLYRYSVDEKMIVPILIAVFILLYVIIAFAVKVFRVVAINLIPKKSGIKKKAVSLFSDFERVIDVKNYLLSVIEFFLGGFVRVFILIQALGIGCRFVESIMMISLNSFVNFIPVSYFGIGTRDAGMIGVFKLLEYGSEHAVALSMAILLSRLIFVFAGAVFWILNPPVSEKI